MEGGAYGKELILDLHECNSSLFTRFSIRAFMKSLCIRIDMEPEDLHFWDDEGVPEAEKETEPHLVGTSAIQFIRTSNITIHTLDILRTVYINIFSCKDFPTEDASQFCSQWFQGNVRSQSEVIRI